MTAPRHAGFPSRHRPHGPGPDWPLRLVVALLFLGAIAIASLPQARAASAAFGWLPLWLAGLPATAWLALAGARRRTATP
ncbi:MAG: hypothetical protein GX856_11190 [Gammaproteobacteria bacterium]|nr:hypothetical protein [Gammaproteobacteria bacterium]